MSLSMHTPTAPHHHHPTHNALQTPPNISGLQQHSQQQQACWISNTNHAGNASTSGPFTLLKPNSVTPQCPGGNNFAANSSAISSGGTAQQNYFMQSGKVPWDASSAHNSGLSKKGNVLKSPEINNGQQRHGKTSNSNTNSILNSPATATTHSSSTHRPSWKERPHVGRYSLIRTIGKGNFAKVKLAQHLTTGIQVAVKVIDKSRLSQSSMQKLFREVRVLKTLNHPNIVKLLEVIESERHLYLVMEYASGGEVFDYLVRHGRMKEGDARAKFRQIISAVQYCHQKMVVHRDLKAENLLLDADMNIKIADFGFSNYYSSVQKLDTFCGSPPYAAPELFLGRRYEGPEVDIWSLGVILYTLVSGTLPFDGKNLKELRERVLRGTYRVPFYMTRECEVLLRKMLILNPTKRQPLVEVMRDSWLNSGSDNPLQPYVEPAVDQYDSDRIEAMVRMGFQRSDIHDALTNQRFNNITATYILLGRNNSRTVGHLPYTNGGGGLTHADQPRKSGQPASRQQLARLPSAVNKTQQPAAMTVEVPGGGADTAGVPSELVGVSTTSSSRLTRPATASAEVGTGQSPVIGGNKVALAGGDLPTLATTSAGARNEPVRRRSSAITVVTNLANQQTTPPSPSCSERPVGTSTTENANSVSPPPSQPPPAETMTVSHHLPSAITIHPSTSPPPLSTAPLAREEKEAESSFSDIKVSRPRSGAVSSSRTVGAQKHATGRKQQQQPPAPVVNGSKVSGVSRSSSTSSDSSSNSCSTATSASLRPGATLTASSPVTVCSATLAAAPHTHSTKFRIHDQVTNVTPGTNSIAGYTTPSLAFTRMGSVRRKPSSATVRAKEFDGHRCTTSPPAAAKTTTTIPHAAFATATSGVASFGANASRFPRVASTSVQQHSRTTIDSSTGRAERFNALPAAGGGGNTTGEPKSDRHPQAYENVESTDTGTPSSFFRLPPSAADILSDTNPFRLVAPVTGTAVDHSPAGADPPSVPPHDTRVSLAAATSTGPGRTFSPNSARNQQTPDSQPPVATASSAAVRRPTAPTPPPLATPLVNNQTVPSRNSYLYHSLRLPSSTTNCGSHNAIEELVNSRHSCNRDAKKPSTLSAALPDVYTPVPFVRNLPERSTIQHVPSGRARQRLEEAAGTTGRLVRHAGRQSIATHSIRLRANPLPTTSITTVNNDSSSATGHKHFFSNGADEGINNADLVVVTPRAVSPIDADTVSLSSDSTAASSTSTSMSILAQHQHHSGAAVAGANRFRRRDMSPDRSAPLAATAERQHRSQTKPVRGTTVGRGGGSPPVSSQQHQQLPMPRHFSMRPASGSTVNNCSVTKPPGTIHGESAVVGGAGINHFFRTLTTRISRSRLFRRSAIIQPNNGHSSNKEYVPGLDVSPVEPHNRHDPKMAPTFELDKVVALNTTTREALPLSGPTGILHAPFGGGHMPRSRSGVATTHHQHKHVNLIDRGVANKLSTSRTQADFAETAQTTGTIRSSQCSFRTHPGGGPATSTVTQSMKTSSHCIPLAENREQHSSRFTSGDEDNQGKFPKSEEASYLGGNNRIGTHPNMRYVIRSNSTHFSLQEVMIDVQQSLSKHGVDFEQIGDMKLHCVYGDPSQGCRVPTVTNGTKGGNQMAPHSGDAQNLNDSGVVHWEMEIGKLAGVRVNGIRFKRINGSMHILRYMVNKIASDMKL